jgi:hypothetical protein
MPPRDLHLPEVPPMSSNDFAGADTFDPKTALAVIEAWFDSEHSRPSNGDRLLVHTFDDRKIGIIIEDVTE